MSAYRRPFSDLGLGVRGFPVNLALGGHLGAAMIALAGAGLVFGGMAELDTGASPIAPVLALCPVRWITGGAFGFEGGVAATAATALGVATVWLVGRNPVVGSRSASEH